MNYHFVGFMRSGFFFIYSLVLPLSIVLLNVVFNIVLQEAARGFLPTSPWCK